MTYEAYARPVLSGGRLGRWLEPFLRDGRQEDWAEKIGVRQPTISRMLQRPDTYEWPLDTVARIAEALNFTTLSDFLSHVEKGTKPAEQPPSRGGSQDDRPFQADPQKATTAEDLYRLGDAFYAAAAAAAATARSGSTPRRTRAGKTITRKSGTSDR